MLTITVVAVAPPKGKGPASCKDSNDNWYKYWLTGKNAVTNIERGGKYEIDTYEKSDERGDQTFISNARLIGATHQQPAASSSGKWQPKSLEERREIFIESLAGRAMGSGQFPATEMKMLVLAAADAWDALQARQSQGQQQAALGAIERQRTLSGDPALPYQSQETQKQRVYNDSHMPEPPPSWEREHPGAH